MTGNERDFWLSIKNDLEDEINKISVKTSSTEISCGALVQN